MSLLCQIKSNQTGHSRVNQRLGAGIAAEARVLNVFVERALPGDRGRSLLEVTLGALGGLVPVGSRVAEALADSNS